MLADGPPGNAVSLHEGPAGAAIWRRSDVPAVPPAQWSHNLNPPACVRMGCPEVPPLAQLHTTVCGYHNACLRRAESQLHVHNPPEGFESVRCKQIPVQAAQKQNMSPATAAVTTMASRRGSEQPLRPRPGAKSCMLLSTCSNVLGHPTSLGQ